MTQAELEQRLSRKTGRTLHIVLTNNRRHALTYRARSREPDILRLSRFFLRADPAILKALAGFITGHAWAKPVLQAYINRESERLGRQRARRGMPVRTMGNRFDLQAILDDLNRSYFSDSVDVRITWGRHRQVKGKKSVQLGIYAAHERLIRIHPVLDEPGIPLHVIEKVVFHEMLHHVMGGTVSAEGRRCLHSDEFRSLERCFTQYDRAERWLRNNLRKVLG
jgi:hypothetical protein